MRRKRWDEDPVAFRIEYSLIAQALHAMTKVPRGDEGPAGRLDDAKEVQDAVDAARRNVSARRSGPEAKPKPASERALELIEMTAWTQRRLGWRWVGGKPPWYVRRARRRATIEDQRLGEFLDRVLEPAAVVLYWSCMVEEGACAEVELLERKPPRRGRIDRRRLARGWGRQAWLADYLTVLRADSRPRLPLLGRFLAHLGLVRLRPAPPPGYRVRYNLACLFSRLAQRSFVDLDEWRDDYLDESVAQLILCLAEARGARRDAIVEWAHSDPGLAALRRIDRKEFLRIVGPAEKNSD